MSGDVIIHAEGLGKKYLIGHEAERERYTALRDVIARRAKALLRTTSDMLRGRAIIGGDTTEEIWALKDINFEIKRGEVVGIIGRNGAGKSTLLKILSRITEPSTGQVEIRGRVSSLLEVGTGFHAELTGRENIFLNGAILGMTRAEIRSKFDEIVAFADVEKFLDTPVKRYSSGMYVRLAFAVAAHLEPEILLVDEVLAVGDAEFQAKCLGKMKDVSKHGRTVLFVSHNMSAVANLCTKAMWIADGSREQFAETIAVVSRYIDSNTSNHVYVNKNRTDASVQLTSMFSHDEFGNHKSNFHGNEEVFISLHFMVRKAPQKFRVGIRVNKIHYGTIFTSCDADSEPMQTREIGDYQISCKIPKWFLSPGVYTAAAVADAPMVKMIFKVEDAISFEISGIGAVGSNIQDGRSGVVRPLLTWYDQRIKPVVKERAASGE
jgi:lipopolysaccharide transport system ATP-binding protein